jgi:hypothetical protein
MAVPCAEPYSVKSLISFAVSVALACGATAAGAQESVHPMPAVGERILVSPADAEPFTGTLTALGGDTMTLAREGDSAVAVSLSQQPVAVLRRHREAWSGLGALAGLAAGLAISQLGSGSSQGVQKASHAVVGGAAGAITGGLLGFVVAPRRWQRLTVVAPRHLPPPPQPADTAAPATATPPPRDTAASPTSAPQTPTEPPAQPPVAPPPPTPAPQSAPPTPPSSPQPPPAPPPPSAAPKF